MIDHSRDLCGTRAAKGLDVPNRQAMMLACRVDMLYLTCAFNRSVSGRFRKGYQNERAFQYSLAGILLLVKVMLRVNRSDG